MQVVKAKLFQEQKEAKKEIKEKCKYNNKVKRVTNALKKAREQEEKEARAITYQLVKDLKKANPVTKKLSDMYVISIRTTLKKNVFIILKARKALIKARILPKSLTKRLVKALIEEVIISRVIRASSSNRIIKLL
jgi:hypothetical protein